jgi:hypothetical protein
MMNASKSMPFEGLRKSSFIALTTFRKGGAGVMTPVWFVLLADKLYVWTDKHSGKVKRLRNSPRLTLAPSNYAGKLRAPAMEGLALILPEAQGQEIEKVFRSKYKLQFSLFSSMARKSEHVYLEITSRPAGPAAV